MQARRHVKSLAALGITVFLGLFSRSVHVGWFVWDKSLGDALYALAAYQGLAFLFPTARPRYLGVVALIYCIVIEAFKFTGLPATWVRFLVSRLILGTTPSWHNVLCYTAAIAVAVCVGEWNATRPTGVRPPIQPFRR